MTDKNELYRALAALLLRLAEENDRKPDPVPEEPVELLTHKECSQLIGGISETSIRRLVLRGKLPAMRVGDTGRGKIFINKSDLLDYFRRTRNAG